MNELIITIENVNPLVIWGSNNEYFEIIKRNFPKIKIVARGNDVKILGDEAEINIFRVKFEELIKNSNLLIITIWSKF